MCNSAERSHKGLDAELRLGRLRRFDDLNTSMLIADGEVPPVLG